MVEGVTGYQVPDGDDVSMADRILRVLQDDELRGRLGEQAVELAACYSWPDVASQLEEVFAGLMIEREQEAELIEGSAVGISLEPSRP